MLTIPIIFSHMSATACWSTRRSWRRAAKARAAGSKATWWNPRQKDAGQKMGTTSASSCFFALDFFALANGSSSGLFFSLLARHEDVADAGVGDEAVDAGQVVQA